MSDIKRKVNMKFAYTGTDFTRQYTIDGISSVGLSGIQSNIEAVNASLAASTDGGLADFFLADDYDGTNGKLKKIADATIETTETTYIFGGN